jgi:Putative auto-transporter adhesin, head GIN domain
MKKVGILIFAVALIIGVSSAFSVSFGKFSFFKQRIAGSGVTKTETRIVEGFQNIEASGAMIVEVTTSTEFLLEVDADDNLLEYVQTEIDGDTLKIYSKGWLSPKTKMIVRVSMPEINEAEASGASNVSISGIQNDRLSVSASGASKITLRGEAQSLVVDLSGASKLDANELQSKNVEVDASGASSASINASETLEADASGASRIAYYGDGVKVNKRTSGASSVSRK